MHYTKWVSSSIFQNKYSTTCPIWSLTNLLLASESRNIVKNTDQLARRYLRPIDISARVTCELPGLVNRPILASDKTSTTANPAVVQGVSQGGRYSIGYLTAAHRCNNSSCEIPFQPNFAQPCTECTMPVSSCCNCIDFLNNCTILVNPQAGEFNSAHSSNQIQQ